MRAFHMEPAFSRAQPALLKLWHLDCWGDSPVEGLKLCPPFRWKRMGISACSVIILGSYRLFSFFIDLTSMDS